MAEGATLAGDVAFKLYDTFGFPYDLTEDALRTHGLTVDRAGFDAAMAQQKAAARAAWRGSGERASDDIWFDIAEAHGSTEFIGYNRTAGEGQIIALVKDGQPINQAGAGDAVIVLTNQTPFYAESGGQIGDRGEISSLNGLRARVELTAKPLGRLHAHHVVVEAGALAAGDLVHLAVDATYRDQIRANHSATHLLHAALRDRLGAHVTQKGSLVAADRLRFDFSHPSALTADDIAAIEAHVNAQIRGNVAVTTRLMTPDDAIKAGAMALFGEKYGDEVRVLAMGGDEAKPYSVELCGGTHVQALGDIALFKIIGESAVSSGIRRVEALTGEAARLWLTHRDDQLRAISATLKSSPDEAAARVTALTEALRKVERELADAKKALALGGGAGTSADAREVIGDVSFMAKMLEGFDPKGLRALVEENKKQLGSGVSAVVSIVDGRATIAVGVTDDLTHKMSAVDLVRAAVSALGGQGGGGRPDMAQGGGPDAQAVASALDAIRALLAA
jgi:alanyl-tRNA synthetase